MATAPKFSKHTHIKEEKPAALVSIGQMITRLREDRHMTQAELGEKIGTTQSVIARIEKGEQNLSTETFAKLSDALNHEIVQLSKGGTVNFRIHGGHKLSGAIKVRTSKNGAVGVMCASLLNRGTTLIKNAPKIEEVFRIMEVFESIGVRAVWQGDDLAITPPEKFDMKNITYDSAAKTRTVIMMIGSLVHSMEKFSLPQAGGCRLGSRTIKPYLYALEELGVKIETSSKYYDVTRGNLKKNREIVMYEAGDMVTETMLMAAALIPGKTTIKFASANYQVQEVAFYLEKLGVKIDGVGTSTMTIHGIDTDKEGQKNGTIKKNVEYFLSEDPIEAMSLLAVAIVTKSSITIERCPIDFLELELLKLEKMGFKYTILKRYKADNGKTNLVDIQTKASNLKALEEKIHANPYPAINTDNLPFFVVIGAVAEGETFIHDWLYEERAIYYKELDKMRAETLLADPHRFYIKGPTKFKATEIVCPPALRPSVIIMIAMLAAEGTSILRNVYNINRGYEDLANRLNALGAKIEVFRDL